MTDKFEGAMQNIAIRSAKNGGPTIADVLVALRATNDDQDDNHQQLLGMISDMREVCAERGRHCPAAHSSVASPADGSAPRTPQATQDFNTRAQDKELAAAAVVARRVWVLWGVGTAVTIAALAGLAYALAQHFIR